MLDKKEKRKHQCLQYTAMISFAKMFITRHFQCSLRAFVVERLKTLLWEKKGNILRKGELFQKTGTVVRMFICWGINNHQYFLRYIGYFSLKEKVFSLLMIRILQLCLPPILQFSFNPFSATRLYKRHQNKVKVKGLGRSSSYLAGFSIFFSWFYEKFHSVV